MLLTLSISILGTGSLSLSLSMSSNLVFLIMIKINIIPIKINRDNRHISTPNPSKYIPRELFNISSKMFALFPTNLQFNISKM